MRDYDFYATERRVEIGLDYPRDMLTDDGHEDLIDIRLKDSS